jgi:hypothetical protein
VGVVGERPDEFEPRRKRYAWRSGNGHGAPTAYRVAWSVGNVHGCIETNFLEEDFAAPPHLRDETAIPKLVTASGGLRELLCQQRPHVERDLLHVVGALGAPLKPPKYLLRNERRMARTAPVKLRSLRHPFERTVLYGRSDESH